MKEDNEDIATRFMIHAVQVWGHGYLEAARIMAVDNLLNAAGFKSKATCTPVFGAIWPKACEGDDAVEAQQWLNDLTKNLKRGKFETEVSQIVAALEKRQGEMR